jgi:hypothetical protein
MTVHKARALKDTQVNGYSYCMDEYCTHTEGYADAVEAGPICAGDCATGRAAMQVQYIHSLRYREGSNAGTVYTLTVLPGGQQCRYSIYTHCTPTMHSLFTRHALSLCTHYALTMH